jgi:hypothetical protein
VRETVVWNIRGCYILDVFSWFLVDVYGQGADGLVPFGGLDCFSQVHATPQHWCEVRRAVEGEQADDPGDDENWHGCQKNFGSAQERQGWNGLSAERNCGGMIKVFSPL